MNKWLKYRAFLAMAMACFAARARADAPPVTASESDTAISMDNGVVGLTITKATGIVSSIRFQVNGKPVEMTGGTRGLLLDFDAGNEAGTRTQHATPFDPKLTKLLNATGDSAEAVIGCGPAGV